MSFKYVAIELTVTTATRYATYKANFTQGLNVIQAPNTWGKSTLIQSLVYGIGLEGAFSASHLSPLGEAMSSVVDLDGQREAVVESSVVLIIQNSQGAYLKTRRFAKSLEYKSELIQVWEAGSVEDLDTAVQTDYFIRQPGSATHDLGFHRVLEEFIGLSLPKVPGYKSDEVKLYLEVLLPLFYIEQKYGWSGLSPRVPTHFRIRSPYRRAAEYVLGLKSLERLKEKESLLAKLAILRAEFGRKDSELNLLLTSQGWSLSGNISEILDDTIFGNEVPLGLELNDKWINAEDHIGTMRTRVSALSDISIESAGLRTRESQHELAEAESGLHQIAGKLQALREKLRQARSEALILEERKNELDRIRETLVDVRKLKKLGSEIHSAALGDANCPTCAQSLEARSVATGIVMDVDSNLALLTAEQLTLTRLLGESDAHKAKLEALVASTHQEAVEARTRVRALKDELAGPSGAPSVSQVQERLALQAKVEAAEAALGRGYALLEQLGEVSQNLVRVEERIKALRGEADDEDDRRIVAQFGDSFKQALRKLGLRSLPVDEITIGTDSLLPEHDGFELSFDIRHGMSASDTIRAKWAHYLALSKTAMEATGGHSLGILIMDEPRQQEADSESVRSLYQELSRASEGVQVIVGSSANDSDMNDLLLGLSANLIAASQPHMFSQATLRE